MIRTKLDKDPDVCPVCQGNRKYKSAQWEHGSISMVIATYECELSIQRNYQTDETFNINRGCSNATAIAIGNTNGHTSPKQETLEPVLSN